MKVDEIIIGRENKPYQKPTRGLNGTQTQETAEGKGGLN